MLPKNIVEELRKRVRAKVGNRLRNLEIRLSSEGIIVRGQAPSYYVKQIAQHSVSEILPQVRLTNEIVVH